ncbi:MAG: cytochrome c biogenesis protein CcsA, partial [Armatimonadetes bacterium]|nr:cytochrome c biogenesis protein CcsA [Armatimonadota bacterium]
VLGWGGYWGWDPVENASLIPWLLATALLHGMLAQRARGTMKRTTLLLAVASFVMVLYGTFLTRSGVLADFSVHSFAEAGAALYWTLVLGMVLSLVAPAILFVRRVREIETDTTYDNLASRDFSFFFGMLVLFISAAIVTFGTSAPILSSVLARLGFDVKPASLQPGFYNRTHYPVAVLLGIIMAMAPLLSWRHTAAEVIRKRLTPHGVVALIGTAAAFLIGVRSGWMLLLIAASLLCLSVAVGVLRRALRENPLHAGAPLSHVGLALMLIGIVGSSVYSRSEKLVLHPGETKEALGYRVKLLGTESPSETRREMKLTLSRGGSEFAATPRMVFSPQMNSWVHSPAVRKYLLQDIYVSPVELRQSEDPGAKHGELGKGESLKAGGYTFTFEKFDMSGHGDGGGSIGAVVKVQQPDGKSATVVPSVTPSESSELVPHPAKLPGTGISVELAGIAVPRVQLSITGLPTAAPAGPREEVVVDVSNKPLINVLWLGTVLVLTGGLVAAVRRSGEAARVEREALQQATEAAGNGHRRRERHKVPSAR